MSDLIGWATSHPWMSVTGVAILLSMVVVVLAGRSVSVFVRSILKLAVCVAVAVWLWNLYSRIDVSRVASTVGMVVAAALTAFVILELMLGNEEPD